MPETERECLRAQTRRLVSILTATLALLLAASGVAVAQQEAGSPDPAPPRAASSAAGVDVAAVQRRLGLKADGVYGPRTRRAVKRFQRRNGLAADGVVGPATLRALGLARRAGRAKGSSAPSALLRKIAQCESGGDPTAVSPGGRYRGKYQFSRATWRSLGGTGDPATAPEAEQDRLAAKLMRTQGPSAWPACSR